MTLISTSDYNRNIKWLEQEPVIGLNFGKLLFFKELDALLKIHNV